jgi:23S rRNA pseudouridine2605 synthase
VRLAKYIARGGVASRRHAEDLVRSGRVLVDGERVTDPARDVDEDNDVSVDGRPVSREPHEHHLLNKPTGVVSTAHDQEGRAKVVDLVRSSARLYPVGRLDADTSGLIMLTNDGELANSLMHPSFEVDKTYRARVQGCVSDEALRLLRSGVELEDGRTWPAHAEIVESSSDTTLLELVIHEGRKRQVRRMCEAAGHPVLALERTAYGPLTLAGLAPGESRPLSHEEVKALRRTVTIERPMKSQMPDTRLHALRGATTVERNDPESIVAATRELMSELMTRNGLGVEQMVSCIFSATGDLDAEFPAVAARDIGLNRVPLLCTREIDVPGALECVIRVLIHYYAADGHRAQHVYLHEAKKLRTDLEAPQ